MRNELLTDVDFDPEEDENFTHPGRAATCSFCGADHFAAYWKGAVTICVCEDCAFRALPSLMADAVSVPPRPLMILERSTELQAKFFRAFSIRMVRGATRINMNRNRF